MFLILFFCSIKRNFQFLNYFVYLLLQYYWLIQKLTKEVADIVDGATLQDLGADSLDMVEIIMNLEEDLSIEISDEKAEQLNSVADVIAYVHELRTK